MLDFNFKVLEEFVGRRGRVGEPVVISSRARARADPRALPAAAPLNTCERRQRSRFVALPAG